MEQDFKIRIIDFYKEVDQPIMTNLFNDNESKNILELSTKNDCQILKKEKNKWIIKDKRKLLKEIDIAKKKKVKEITNNFNNISKPEQSISILKDTNNKLISEIESIDDFKEKINNDDLYKKLKNLASINCIPKNNLIKTKKGGGYKENIIQNNKEEEIINIKIVDIKKSLISSETNSDFIEVFSNSF